MGISNLPDNSMTQSLAADPQAMANISAKINTDPKAAVHEVAQQFEAMFLNNLLKTMRETHYSDDDQSSEMQTYRGLLDEQMVQSMTSGRGLGLTQVLEQQIGRLAHVDDGGQGTAPSSDVVGSLPLSNRALKAYQAALAQAHAQAQAQAQAPAPAAASGSVDNASPTAAGASGFARALLPQATQAAAKLGVAPELLVAHAALESGWGKRAIRNANGSDSHNLFGIKAGSDWRGATTNIVTTEYVNGVAQKKVDSFRAYGSYQEAFADYANVLSASPRYRNVLNQGRNIQGYAQGLQDGGYATDPRYAHKLVDVMSSLAQYMA
ncbi:flagellar assembly peptidoglycan hydrolase FlgJ [Paludibacterium sp.]|uniref:flagellar assembly peptidoglycan hydrolase FlgJ n=1 Tax=Paludibacterium sp. TaxID=1917523 RepID=UPI0025FD6EEA|nr:flagellar assembly peptidoglycan hydrolase FlgJ [Paludibacterium sp.]MBV8647236.1 flagellar assembly peptidoglycan hydrolase FlgJ [Paludibacterium sp.]